MHEPTSDTTARWARRLSILLRARGFRRRATLGVWMITPNALNVSYKIFSSTCGHPHVWLRACVERVWSCRQHGSTAARAARQRARPDASLVDAHSRQGFRRTSWHQCPDSFYLATPARTTGVEVCECQRSPPAFRSRPCVSAPPTANTKTVWHMRPWHVPC